MRTVSNKNLPPWTRKVETSPKNPRTYWSFCCDHIHCHVHLTHASVCGLSLYCLVLRWFKPVEVSKTLQAKDDIISATCVSVYDVQHGCYSPRRVNHFRLHTATLNGGPFLAIWSGYYIPSWLRSSRETSVATFRRKHVPQMKAKLILKFHGRLLSALPNWIFAAGTCAQVG